MAQSGEAGTEPAKKRPRTVDEDEHDLGVVFPPRETKMPVELGKTAVLIIDCQEYFWEYASDYAAAKMRTTVLPNTQAFLKSARKAKLEIIYVVAEALTRDARETSLCYKHCGIFVPRGSPKAKVLPEIAPEEDDIVIRKTSVSVFNSTNINYVLRNLGIRHLIFTGVITNYCVESAVRDAGDLGYRCTLLEDCCAAHSEAAHEFGLKNMERYVRIKSFTEMAHELEQLSAED